MKGGQLIMRGGAVKHANSSAELEVRIDEGRQYNAVAEHAA